VPDRLKLPFEIAIILVIAAALQFIPGGHKTLEALFAALWSILLVGLFFVCIMQYREHRVALYSLGDGRRALLYGTTAVLVVTLAATERMWHASGVGEFFWFAIVGLSIYTYVALYRFARRY
jgi:hypothetical protein